jgi:hypothetical protein
MNKFSLVSELTKNRITDYSFIVAFFIIFSFFVLFAIKPNLETAFKLQREITALRALDQNYNDAITQIVDVQTKLLEHRDDAILLDQALPDTPSVHSMIGDMQTSASGAGVQIGKINIAEINLKKTENPAMRRYLVTMETTSQFAEVKNFIDSFFSQRRLKLVKRVDIGRADGQTEDASASSQLRVTFDLEGYYL